MRNHLASLTHTSHSHIAARTATVTASGVDVSDYSGPLLIIQNIGTVSGTNPTWDGKIEDSADDSSYASVTGATFTQVTASNSTQTLLLDTRAVRKYIRYVGTVGGTSTPTFSVGVTTHGVKNYI